MDREERERGVKIGGGGEEEVGFEPSLLPWQHLAVRRVQMSTARKNLCRQHWSELRVVAVSAAAQKQNLREIKAFNRENN